MFVGGDFGTIAGQAWVWDLWSLGMPDAGMQVDAMACTAFYDGFGIGQIALCDHNPMAIVGTNMCVCVTG